MKEAELRVLNVIESYAELNDEKMDVSMFYDPDAGRRGIEIVYYPMGVMFDFARVAFNDGKMADVWEVKTGSGFADYLRKNLPDEISHPGVVVHY